MIKKIICIMLAVLCIPIASCTNDSIKEDKEEIMYENITPQKAKELMERDTWVENQQGEGTQDSFSAA